MLYLAETEMHKIKDDSKIKRQINLDHHGPIPIPIICHLLDPPSFSLPCTGTFKQCSGSVTYGTGTKLDPHLWLTNPDPALDLALFVSDLQDATKKVIFAYYLLSEGTFKSFFYDKEL